MSDPDAQGVRAWLDRYAQSTHQDVIYGIYGGVGSFELTISGLRGLLALVDAQAARIDKARAEHRRIENRAFPPLHALNGEVIHEGMPAGPPTCIGCQRLWPCPTVRALTGGAL